MNDTVIKDLIEKAEAVYQRALDANDPLTALQSLHLIAQLHKGTV